LVGLYSKADVQKEVDLLLKLKKEFLAATGQEWKPDAQPTAVASGSKEKQSAPKEEPVKATPAPGGVTPSGEAEELKAKIEAQGNRVRQLKTSGASKVKITLGCF